MASVNELKERMRLMKEDRRKIRLQQNFVMKVVKERFGKTLYSLETLEEYEKALLAGGRDFGPWLLFRWHREGCLTQKILRAILINVWNGAEFPEVQLGQKQSITFFRQAGYLTDCKLPRPTAPLSVYRGCTRQMVKRMSWTTRLETARFFAKYRQDRYGAPEGFVYSAEVAPDGVLATSYDGRPGEDEVIVDPSFLSAIQIESK